MHPHAQTHGNLLKWNTQSLTFTSVRPHSFDRKRIQTEWNHHQRGCCAIDLSSPLCSLTDRREHWRMGWGGGCLDSTQSLCFCLCTGLPEWHRDGERETERQRNKARDTSFSHRNEKRPASLWAPPHNNAHLKTATGGQKRCKSSRALNRFLTSERHREWEWKEGARDRNTDE